MPTDAQRAPGIQRHNKGCRFAPLLSRRPSAGRSPAPVSAVPSL
ncbi:Uncharacterized protein EbC_pEb17201650 (plasmid) [Erwinia billingiae Eb661]|uniref:Uncharacterized protein n=1 Tax=Erwinia billingiae (strain Eb661) TaxID=634500 RepID=D8MK20_ERWBE|nr:Uncharacterized protein EbC_pEb17201650 [Erwinia billingiae Eb661]